MHWKLSIEKVGQPTYEREGYVEDPFWEMKSSLAGQQGARVSSTVQRSTNYGELKCSFTITIDCLQTEQWMERAAQYAFRTAVQYVNDGFSYLDRSLPPLEVPQWNSKT